MGSICRKIFALVAKIHWRGMGVTIVLSANITLTKLVFALSVILSWRNCRRVARQIFSVIHAMSSNQNLRFDLSFKHKIK